MIDFGYAVLNSESLDFKINIVPGNEALCQKDKKIINFGTNAVNNNDRKLMLHEIAHIKTNNHHYSEEFQNVYKELCKTYM